MSDNIYENNVYSYLEPMWHSKGIVSKKPLGAVKVYRKMKPVEFESRPYFIRLNNKKIEDGKHAIVRIDGGFETIIGFHKGRYQITQPVEYCKEFDTRVGKHVETLGFLGARAEKMFITWELPNMDVRGDVIRNYGFLAVGFDGVFGAKLCITGVRVVCNNTWNMAIEDAESAAEESTRGIVTTSRHNSANHLRDLGLWMEYINQEAEEYFGIYEGLFRKWQEVPVSTDLASNLFSKVYPYANAIPSFMPSVLKVEKEAKKAEFDSKQDESRELAMSLFQGAGIEITPDVWGVWNCVTEVENHHRPSKKDTTNSILLGNRHQQMNFAKDVLADFVGVEVR